MQSRPEPGDLTIAEAYRRVRDRGRDDERDIVVTDPAGTPSRPLRVQRGQPPLAERVEHISDGVLIGATSRAIAGTGVPDGDSMMVVARRTRIGFPDHRAQSESAGGLPRRSTGAL